MNYWLSVYCGLLGLGIGFLGVPLVLKVARRVRLSPRRQDLHNAQAFPVPRWGGVVLVAAFLVTVSLGAVLHSGLRRVLVEDSVIVIAPIAMFALGFWDDLKPLGARRKLLGQVLIATAVCVCGIGIGHLKIPFTDHIIDLHGWGAVITVLWLVGMTNLINLIDGVDGLAGGICLMLMALLAYVGHQTASVGVIATGLAGALLAFLWFNFPPARIYLGDGGAYFLGFQIGLLAILSSNKGTVFAALVAPLFVLALPILDVTLAILRRGLRGLPVFRPDRRHIHHHLMDMGLSRKKVVLSLYAVTLVFLAMGFAAFASRGQLIPLLAGLAIIVLLLCAGKLSFSREWFAVGRVVGNSLGMRQEVEYALALTRWLALEGKRSRSVEELWSHLVFAGQRLGFSYIRLTLADEHRTWEQTQPCEPSHSVRHQLQGGRLGTLELKAPTCDPDHAAPALAHSRPPQCKSTSCPCVSDGRVFAIISDLLAEGWAKAAMEWNDGKRTPLQFNAGVPLPKSAGQRLAPESAAAPPLAATGQEPLTSP